MKRDGGGGEGVEERHYGVVQGWGCFCVLNALCEFSPGEAYRGRVVRCTADNQRALGPLFTSKAITQSFLLIVKNVSAAFMIHAVQQRFVHVAIGAPVVGIFIFNLAPAVPEVFCCIVRLSCKRCSCSDR